MARSSPPEMSGNAAAEAVPETVVREQLARIVESPKFIPSARLCRFLTHIVNRTLSGDLDCLKEFSIAMDGVRPHVQLRSERRRHCPG